MRVLVAYASKHGATQGIAERIGAKLSEAGLQADVRSVEHATDLEGYDAFVIGGALYMYHWMKDASKFTHRHRMILAGRPVWLFSSGPVGTETTDDKGRDLREVAGPRELPELERDLHPRDHHVFYGAVDHAKLGKGLIDRMTAKWMPEGDYRDWDEIDAWAAGIAEELKGPSVH